MEATAHPFAHLGAAPYRYLGHERISYQAIPGDSSCPVQPGGSCDHCSTAIFDAFRFRSADGKVFKVGSSCVDKANDPKLKQAIRADVAKHRREVAHASADRKIDAALALLPTVSERLAAQPHPTRTWGGATLLDWCEWMLAHAGRKGKVEVAKVIMAAA